LRKLFKEIDSGGTLRRDISTFGTGLAYAGHLSQLGATAILREQKSAVEARRKLGGEFAVLHWELDATPQQVALETAIAVAILSRGGVHDECQSKKGTREVLIQRATLVTDDNKPEELFIKPLLLGDESSSTLLDAMMKRMRDVGVDLEEFSAGYGEILLHFGIDGAAVCELTIDYVKCLAEVFDNVITMPTSICQMHCLNRIMADHQKSGRFKLSTIFSLTKLLHVGSYFDTFAKQCLLDPLGDDIEWHQVGGPPWEEVILHDRLINLALPNLKNQKKRQKAVNEGKAVVNGTWRKCRAVHHCVILQSTGLPCCNNIADVRAKVKTAKTKLCLSSTPDEPCATRWLTCYETLGWWALGIMLAFGLFARSFMSSWPDAGEAMHIDQKLIDRSCDIDSDKEDYLGSFIGIFNLIY